MKFDISVLLLFLFVQQLAVSRSFGLFNLRNTVCNHEIRREAIALRKIASQFQQPVSNAKIRTPKLEPENLVAEKPGGFPVFSGRAPPVVD